MADDSLPKKEKKFFKNLLLASTVLGLGGLGLGLENEGDVKKRHEAEPPPSAEVAAAEISAAEQHTPYFVAAGALLGAAGAVGNAAAERAIQNRKRQKKTKTFHDVDPSSPGFEVRKEFWRTQALDKERQREEDRNL